MESVPAMSTSFAPAIRIVYMPETMPMAPPYNRMIGILFTNPSVTVNPNPTA